ncbi:YqgE/AlgH family protein [Stomatohabitans albus]|uniref:YqgE/AlgH family protein n=1 Tax=Stomatohabitans albus TaxID=3110766 RepID=UPI00300CBBB0
MFDQPFPIGPATRGQLLVASPHLVDPNFAETVVFLIEHDNEGAMGVVLNHAAANEEEAFLAWADYEVDQGLGVAAPSVPFIGGPVAPEYPIVLIGKPDGENWHLNVTTNLDALNSEEYVRRRLFFGHAGWEPGQLEGELSEGSWIVVDSLPDDPFTGDPDGLWRRVLSRQGGMLRSATTTPQFN